MLLVLRWVLWRDLTLAIRNKSEVFTALLFFVIVISLFPLGVGPEKKTLMAIAPGILWVAALLASMLALNRLFSTDYADGTLEQMLIANQPLSLIVLMKVIGHWLVTGLPLVLMAPLLAMQLGLESEAIVILTLTLLLGTPTLSLIGAVGAGLTLGVRGGGVLLALLVLPLYVPVLIFGSGAVELARFGLDYQANLSFLGAMLILAFLLAPWGAAAALRISLD